MKIILFEKNLNQLTKEFLPQNVYLALQKMSWGSGNRKNNLFRIRTQGSKKHRIPDPEQQH